MCIGGEGLAGLEISSWRVEGSWANGSAAGISCANCWSLRSTLGWLLELGMRILPAIGRVTIGDGHERCWLKLSPERGSTMTSCSSHSGGTVNSKNSSGHTVVAGARRMCELALLTLAGCLRVR